MILREALRIRLGRTRCVCGSTRGRANQTDNSPRPGAGRIPPPFAALGRPNTRFAGPLDCSEGQFSQRHPECRRNVIPQGGQAMRGCQQGLGGRVSDGSRHAARQWCRRRKAGREFSNRVHLTRWVRLNAIRRQQRCFAAERFQTRTRTTRVGWDVESTGVVGARLDIRSRTGAL